MYEEVTYRSFLNGCGKYWFMTGSINKLLAIPPDKIVFFDTETTGTKLEKDEILQLSIVDGVGTVLFNSFIKPLSRKTWRVAEEVNGISPKMVKNAPSIEEVKEQVQKIFSEAELIVAYNAEFDLMFLVTAGIKIDFDKYVFDVMLEYSYVNNKYDGIHYDPKWTTLSQCAKHYKYKFLAHDSLEDVKATRHCYYAMLREDKCRSENMIPYLRMVEIGKEARDRQFERIKEKEEAERLKQKEAEVKKREEDRKRAEELRKIQEEQQNMAVSEKLHAGEAQKKGFLFRIFGK